MGDLPGKGVLCVVVSSFGEGSRRGSRMGNLKGWTFKAALSSTAFPETDVFCIDFCVCNEVICTLSFENIYFFLIFIRFPLFLLHLKQRETPKVSFAFPNL